MTAPSTTPSTAPRQPKKPKEIQVIRPPVWPGKPVVVRVPEATVIFDHIPTLKELLPQFHGIPGFYYLQVAVQGKSIAEREGWAPVADRPTYTIMGPEGSCDMNLYCVGDRVPGVTHQSGKRTCEVDLNIREITGLWDDGDPRAFKEPEPPEVKGTSSGNKSK
jgi:hypothetical protein